MNESEFKDTLDKLARTNSRNEKKQIIAGLDDEPAAISFLSGSEFDDAGLGKKTVHDVAQDVFGDSIDGKPTVSESLEAEDSDIAQGLDLETLRYDVEKLAELSGNEMKEHLADMFGFYCYPSVVAHACLNDYPTGVGDSTIATAMGVKDSLPFYDGVHEIAAADDEITTPVVGRAFKPQLAKSESSLPDDISNLWGQVKLDGYRIIIHIKEREMGREVKAFTRRMNDVTESLPELDEISFPAGEYIIDAEVIAEDGTYKSTSERIGRNADNVERDVEMHFGVFDTIIYAGESVWNEPYRKRHQRLESFDLNTGDRVERLQVYTDEDEARKAGREFEGLIWKDPDAAYEFDKRSKNWIKEKNTSETVDLVAAGFEEGEGRLDGTLGKILLETADGHSVGATGSGFTDEERGEIWQNQDEYRGETLEVEGEAFDSGVRFPIFQRWRSDDGEPDILSRVENVLPET
jgi:ATP-dependent DNA ligase